MSLGSLYSWCTLSPQNASVALMVIGFLTNIVIRFFTSKEWETILQKHPRLSGVCLVLKGLFPEWSTILRGLLGAITGELEARSKAQPIEPPSSP